MNEEHGRPEIQVTYLNTNEEVKFHAEWGWNLQQVWDAAYTELEETKKQGDLFKSASGTDLTPYLNKTVREVFDAKIVHPLRFEIRSATGGAR